MPRRCRGVSLRLRYEALARWLLELQFLQLEPGVRIARVDECTDRYGFGNKLVQKLHSLWYQLGHDKAHPRDITTRSI